MAAKIYKDCIRYYPFVLGAQPVKVGGTHLFVVPNPSGANAHFTRQEQTLWYDQLAAFLGRQSGR